MRATDRVLALVILSLLSFVVRAQTPQATPPPPAAPRSVVFPKPVEQGLPNGLRVIVIERHESPLVSVQVVMKNGWSDSFRHHRGQRLVRVSRSVPVGIAFGALTEIRILVL